VSPAALAPHTAPVATVPAPAERLFAELGPIAERTTLASSGWSGNRLDRIVLEDGSALIAKRIVPRSDWLGRVTRDPGREALLHFEGAYARMAPDVDAGVVATEREGDAWWIVMRDVGRAARRLHSAHPRPEPLRAGGRGRRLGGVLGRRSRVRGSPERPPGL
jgi:hypothetical protein